MLAADGVARVGVEEVHALGVDHDLDLVADPDPGAGAKAATNLVPWNSAWVGASSVWASLSSSLVSSVTVALRRVSAGASRTSRASSMSSLRIPTATSRDTWEARAGRACSTDGWRRMLAEPSRTARPLPSSRTTLPMAMFIGGEPMKPATKMLAGLSYRYWGFADLLEDPGLHHRHPVPMVMASVWSWVT
jgi:hypothetical protein